MLCSAWLQGIKLGEERADRNGTDNLYLTGLVLFSKGIRQKMIYVILTIMI